MKDRIVELLKDKDFFKQLAATANLSEAVKLFAENGVDAKEDEIKSVLSELFSARPDEQLSQDDLATVVGGMQTWDEMIEDFEREARETIYSLISDSAWLDEFYN